ncbi:MAG: hypothetical protein HY666_04825 [Chloroflexi bacterium]|nr:hypothetical protein [Chloroflexota bacterium]
MIRQKLLSLTIITLAMVFLAVSLGVAPIAQAAQGKKQGIFGVVSAIGKDSITLQSAKESVELKIDPNTKATIPGIATATVPEIPLGSRVAMLAEQRSDGLFALKITVVPAKPDDQHITLTVVEVSGNTVIAENSEGEQVIVEADFQLPSELKGQLVTFLGQQPESNRFKAKAAMKLQNVIARLDGHIKEKKKDAEGEKEPKAKNEKQKGVETLKQRLENLMKEQMNRFEEIIARAPESAKPSLEQASQRVKTGFQTALQALDKTPQDAQDVLERRKIQGTIESIDSASGKVVVHSKGDALITLSITPETEITIQDQKGAVGSLQVGDRVEVRFDPSSKVASKVEVHLTGEADGRIQSIDLAANKMTVGLPGQATITVSVTSSTKTRIGSQSVSLNAFQPGMKVEIEYNLRTLQAISISSKQEAEFELTIDKVDAETKTITGHTKTGETVTFKVTDNTNIEVEGASSSIFGLQPGTRLEVEINTATGEAIKIEVQDEKRMREVKTTGTVLKVDVHASSLTVKLPNGSTVTVTITKATQIELDDLETATLADIPSGDHVKVTYDQDTMSASEIEVKGIEKDKGRPEQREKLSRARGTITGVNPNNSTVTIFTEKGETLVLSVAKSTSITLNGVAVPALADLPIAAEVNVKFTRPNNLAVEIEAKKAEAKREDKGQPKKAPGRMEVRVEGNMIPGGKIAIKVTLDRAPVQGATVAVGSKTIGTTDAQGTVVFDIPTDAKELEIKAKSGEQERELKVKLQEQKGRGR